MEVLIKKYGNTHALWFSRSKSFLLLEEPAFDVFRMRTKQRTQKEIIAFCQQKYGHIEHRMTQFVSEVIDLLEYYDSTQAINAISQKHRVDPNQPAPSFFDTVHYRIGKKIIRIRYGNSDLKWAIHPMQAHLVTEEISEENEIECIEQHGLLVCRHNGKLVEAFKKEDVEYFTGNVKQLMYSIVYSKGFNDWMAMLHASGIEKDGQAVLFSAAAGSGKTTVSALLKAHGYGYLSDDFIAADEQGKAYPFPAAVSVKEGSVPVLSTWFPELLQKNPEQTFIGKSVRYIPVSNLKETVNTGFPLKAFVFVQYQNDGHFRLEKVEKHKALQLLLRETWVNPQEKYVQAFFDWVVRTPFYRLQYSETRQALDAVEQIFGD